MIDEPQSEEVQRWTAKRRAAPVISLLKGDPRPGRYFALRPPIDALGYIRRSYDTDRRRYQKNITLDSRYGNLRWNDPRLTAAFDASNSDLG
jgi:hypothetical protein